MIEVALLTVKHAAVGEPLHGVVVIAVVPTVTRETIGWPAAWKSVPVRPTALPPNGPPAFGETPVTVGIGATYVYGRLPVVPPGVVTVTLTLPGGLAGMMTVICVLLSMVKHAPEPHGLRSEAPTFTSVAPLKFVPVRVTLLPPAVAPEVGLSIVNVGAGVT